MQHAGGCVTVKLIPSAIACWPLRQAVHGSGDTTCSYLLFHDGHAGVRRELYLCDDGKDPTKRVWLETTYGESSHNMTKGKVHYVSGR